MISGENFAFSPSLSFFISLSLSLIYALFHFSSLSLSPFLALFHLSALSLSLSLFLTCHFYFSPYQPFSLILAAFAIHVYQLQLFFSDLSFSFDCTQLYWIYFALAFVVFPDSDAMQTNSSWIRVRKLKTHVVKVISHPIAQNVFIFPLSQTTSRIRISSFHFRLWLTLKTPKKSIHKSLFFSLLN